MHDAVSVQWISRRLSELPSVIRFLLTGWLAAAFGIPLFCIFGMRGRDVFSEERQIGMKVFRMRLPHVCMLTSVGLVTFLLVGCATQAEPNSLLWDAPQPITTLDDGTVVALRVPIRKVPSSDDSFGKVFGSMFSCYQIVALYPDGKLKEIFNNEHVAIDGPLPRFKNDKTWILSGDETHLVLSQWSGIYQVIDLKDFSVQETERYQAGVIAKQFEIDVSHWFFDENHYCPEKLPQGEVGPMWVKSYEDEIMTVYPDGEARYIKRQGADDLPANGDRR